MYCCLEFKKVWTNGVRFPSGRSVSFCLEGRFCQKSQKSWISEEIFLIDVCLFSAALWSLAMVSTRAGSFYKVTLTKTMLTISKKFVLVWSVLSSTFLKFLKDTVNRNWTVIHKLTSLIFFEERNHSGNFHIWKVEEGIIYFLKMVVLERWPLTYDVIRLTETQ